MSKRAVTGAKGREDDGSSVAGAGALAAGAAACCAFHRASLALRAAILRCFSFVASIAAAADAAAAAAMAGSTATPKRLRFRGCDEALVSDVVAATAGWTTTGAPKRERFLRISVLSEILLR